MRTATAILRLTGVALVCAACGGGTAAPATGATPQPTQQAARNFVRGEIVQLKGDRVVLTSKDGTDTAFTMTPSTTFRQEQDALLSDATVGTCAFGFGERVGTDLVAAAQVVLGAHGPKGPDDCRRGSGGGLHKFGVAGGEITAISGDTYTVNSNAGPQRFQVNNQTKAVRLVEASASNLSVGQCVTARGPKNGSGEVTAKNVVISPNVVGGCFADGGGLRGATGGGGG
jgi:Domain of unknown function (DUF5666)